MPLLPGKKHVGHNIEMEEKAGKPHKQSLAIALNVSRMAKKKKKMAQGGMVPTDQFAEDMLDSHPLEHKAELKAGSMRPSADSHEQRSDDMLDDHSLMGKPERSMLGSRVSADSGNEDQGRDMDMAEGRRMMRGGELRAASMPKQTIDSGDLDESRDMEMLDDKPMSHMAEIRGAGGPHSTADSGDSDDRDMDMISSIMSKRRSRMMAQGGMVDHEVEEGRVDQHGNQDESKNLEDDLSFSALHDPMQDSMIDKDQPMDSNEMGDDREKDSEDEHDHIDMLRKKILSKRGL